MEFSDLIKDYLDDANSHLSVFDNALLTLEHSGVDRETIVTTLGALHTLKGNSGMMGLDSLKDYIHRIESVLKNVLEEELPLDTAIDTLLESANRIRDSLVGLERDPNHPPDMSADIQKLERLTDESAASAPPAPQAEREPGKEQGGAEKESAQPPAGPGKKEDEAAALEKEQGASGFAELDTRPERDIEKGAEKAEPPAETREDKAPAETAAGSARSLLNYLGARTDTIKVDFMRLDELLNLVGELVIFKTRMTQIEGRVKNALMDKALNREMEEGMQLISKTVSDLQEGIMRIRMLPVRDVFSKFPRMVRDLAYGLEKQVSLEFSGEDTELDKTVIDELGEPLIHLIRNSVDHGIELPEDRMRAGKDPVGTLTISALQESNFIIIKVSDDGKGIDPEAIKAKAVAKGLMREDESVEQEQLLSLIFSPGFSTREEATDLSGRGVGLDVVSRNISRLNGSVSVESTPGKGSTFTIKLPLSLAIVPALMAEVGDELYAVPMSAVDESVKVEKSELHIINNREVIRLRDRVVPVVRLSRFFGLGGELDDRFYLIVIGKEEKRVALAVDRLWGQQEIVIKPIDDTFGSAPGIAGASILGDGRIVLIIDVLAFWQRRQGTSEPGAAGMEEAKAGGGRQKGMIKGDARIS